MVNVSERCAGVNKLLPLASNDISEQELTNLLKNEKEVSTWLMLSRPTKSSIG